MNIDTAGMSQCLKAAIFGLGLAYAVPATAEVEQKNFQVVGNNSSAFFWSQLEREFWMKTLPENSDGKLTANAVPSDELGLTGFELLRLLKLGAYDIVTPTLGFVTQDSPALEGADLPGVARNLAEYRASIDAYRPVIERELNEKAGAKLLAIYPWPGLQLYCNLGSRDLTNFSLADLKGKRIRTFSTAIGDFIEGLGATPVTIAFSEVIPSLQRGVIDCAITSNIAAYASKIYQVTTHNIAVNAGYAATLIVINKNVWDGLNVDTQATLARSLSDFEAKVWKQSEHMGEMAYACLRSGPCDNGEIGKLVVVQPSDSEDEALRKMVQDFVVGRWAQRCGAEACIDDWNESIGKVMGISAAN